MEHCNCGSGGPGAPARTRCSTRPGCTSWPWSASRWTIHAFHAVRGPPPRLIGMPPVAALADAVVHGLDVRRPLGLPGRVPTESLAPLADFSLGTLWPMNIVVGGSARRRVSGVGLVATDLDWTHGAGPE